MSTLAMRSSVGNQRKDDLDEICPVCKSSKYLDRSIKFLVNPECYHKMCQSCVDRLFSHGPAMCPIHGCGRTLRKARFREQKFEDLRIEKEVDIRKRIADTFSKEEEEFETLNDYNNYLEEMETITFNLLNRIDVAESEAKLRAYAAQNMETDDANGNGDTPGAGSSVGTPSLTGTSGENFTAIQLKRSSARGTAADRLNKNKSAINTPDSFSGAGTPIPEYHLKGLRKIVAPKIVAEKPYSPFGGRSIKPEHYVLQEHYDHPWLDNARTDPQILAGGYTLQEYYHRTIFEAFSGLAVFIDEEVKERPMGIQQGLMGLTIAEGDKDVKMS